MLIEKGASVDQATTVSCHGLSSSSVGPDPVDVFACCAEPYLFLLLPAGDSRLTSDVLSSGQLPM